MIDVLTTLKNEMEKQNIPYTFDEWDKDIELPQFIGEISETTNINEDGNIILNTGTDNKRVTLSHLVSFAKNYNKMQFNIFAFNSKNIKDDNMNINSVNRGLEKWRYRYS